MKIVIKTVIFQILSVALFSFLYLSIKTQFARDTSYSYSHQVDSKNLPTFLDCFFLATTVQSGVGYSDIYPITAISKSAMILQQFSMISTNIFLLYIFTL